MSALVILPTYNEKENLAGLVPAILKINPKLKILIVDDNSPDGTGELANKLASRYPEKVFLLSRPQKQGLGPAYRAGFEWATKHNPDYLITMDADWSHNPKDIPLLLKTARETNFVIGSRYLGGIRVLDWSLKRLLLSILGNYYVKWVTGLPIQDCTAGFQCFRLSVLKKCRLLETKSSGYGFLIEMKYRAWKENFSLKEIPIIFSERRAGKPKMNKSIALEAIFLVWRLKWQKMAK